MTTENIDPVCGKPVIPGDTTPTTECHGEAMFFCSRACLEKFVCDPAKTLNDYVYDLVIVGGGPAGLSAGIYATLTDLDTLFLTKSLGGQAWDSTRVVNYPGFDVISGPDLIERFRNQLFEGPHLAHQVCTVTDITKEGGTFILSTDGVGSFRGRAVLLTTGMRRRALGIPGELELRGKGVGEFHALLAPRYAGKAVAVVGGGNSATQAALSLAQAGARVTLVCRGYGADSYLKEKIAQHPEVTLLEDREPVRIEGDGRVEALAVHDLGTRTEESLAVEAVFVEVGLIPSSDLVRDLATINRRGEVETDGNCRTGLPGLYAAGDVASSFGKRILIAAGEGAKAVLAVGEYLSSRRPPEAP